MGGDGRHGAWEPVQFEARADAGGVTHQVGPDVVGTIVYTPSSHVSAQIGSTYIAHAGAYELHEARVLHHVRHSLSPDWVGTVQERFYEVTGDDLYLRTPPMEVAGRTVVGELRWRRG